LVFFFLGAEFGVTTLELGKHGLLMPCLLDFIDILLPQRKNPSKGL
jgi:hypothetical protein